MRYLKAVVQEDVTGCGIACVAVLAGTTYLKVKASAMAFGITVTDPLLWSDTAYVRTLLTHYGIQTMKGESPFRSWEALPPLALLASKWHRRKNQAYWHWVVYWRSPHGPLVLDPKNTLRKHVRTDFGRIKPRWCIKIHTT